MVKNRHQGQLRIITSLTTNTKAKTSTCVVTRYEIDLTNNFETNSTSYSLVCLVYLTFDLSHSHLKHPQSVSKIVRC